MSLHRSFRLLWLAAACISQLAAQKWQVQYFHDKAKSTFAITDLQFPSAVRGVAVGVLVEGYKETPSSVVTADGGAHWQTVPLKERPVSLFFLNENLGWMVTNKGLWRTVEAGKSWAKLPNLPGQVQRVHFLTEMHGWAIGAKRLVLETQDGGIRWKPVAAAAAAPHENLRYSSYTCIAFASPRNGVITGWNLPPRPDDPELPNWVDPEGTARQRALPHLTYTLSTSDGGATWRPSSGSLFGVVARIRFAADGNGLGLMQYADGFRIPSEVYGIAWPTGGTHTVYRDPNFAVSDIWLASDGTAYLSGVQSRSSIRGLIPEHVQVLTSKDLVKWTPIAVDYRAAARRTLLAAADDEHIWMATDTGMILQLKR